MYNDTKITVVVLVLDYCCYYLLFFLIAAEGIELQPLNGQGQKGDKVDTAATAQPDANWEAHDAVDVVVLDGKKKRE